MMVMMMMINNADDDDDDGDEYDDDGARYSEQTPKFALKEAHHWPVLFSGSLFSANGSPHLLWCGPF